MKVGSAWSAAIWRTSTSQLLKRDATLLARAYRIARTVLSVEPESTGPCPLRLAAPDGSIRILDSLRGFWTGRRVGGGMGESHL